VPIAALEKIAGKDDEQKWLQIKFSVRQTNGTVAFDLGRFSRDGAG
jgi:hypothetical protein